MAIISPWYLVKWLNHHFSLAKRRISVVTAMAHLDAKALQALSTPRWRGWDEEPPEPREVHVAAVQQDAWVVSFSDFLAPNGRKNKQKYGESGDHFFMSVFFFPKIPPELRPKISSSKDVKGLSGKVAWRTGRCRSGGWDVDLLRVGQNWLRSKNDRNPAMLKSIGMVYIYVNIIYYILYIIYYMLYLIYYILYIIIINYY